MTETAEQIAARYGAVLEKGVEVRKCKRGESSAPGYVWDGHKLVSTMSPEERKAAYSSAMYRQAQRAAKARRIRESAEVVDGNIAPQQTIRPCDVERRRVEALVAALRADIASGATWEQLLTKHGLTGPKLSGLKGHHGLEVESPWQRRQRGANERAIARKNAPKDRTSRKASRRRQAEAIVAHLRDLHAQGLTWDQICAESGLTGRVLGQYNRHHEIGIERPKDTAKASKRARDAKIAARRAKVAKMIE